MKRAGWSRLVSALLLGASGCGREGSSTALGARLEVEWTGADTGKMATAAGAEWCGARRTLEIRGLQGDSGIAILLYPADTVRPDSYPVVPPARADSVTPAAAVALRWFAETELRGYRGDSGSVILDPPVGGVVSGRFTAGLQAVNQGSRLSATGRFDGLSVVPASQGCVPRAVGQPADTGIH